MDEDEPESFAFPDPGTVRSVAVCVNCGETLADAGSGWRHEATGMTGCA